MKDNGCARAHLCVCVYVCVCWEEWKWLYIVVCLGAALASRDCVLLNLMPNVMVFRGGTFGRCLGHEGENLMKQMSAFTEETPQRPLILFTM